MIGQRDGAHGVALGRLDDAFDLQVHEVLRRRAGRGLDVFNGRFVGRFVGVDVDLGVFVPPGAHARPVERSGTWILERVSSSHD